MTSNIFFVHDRRLIHSTSSIEGESPELVEVLQKIAQNVGALLEVHDCSVALLDTAGTTLITLAALSNNEHQPQHPYFHLNESAASWVAEHHETLIVNNVELDPRFKDLEAAHIGSIMCIPLMEKGNFIGILTVSSQEIDAFNEAKTKMPIIFAGQVLLAVSNARHMELARQQAQQL